MMPYLEFTNITQFPSDEVGLSLLEIDSCLLFKFWLTEGEMDIQFIASALVGLAGRHCKLTVMQRARFNVDSSSHPGRCLIGCAQNLVNASKRVGFPGFAN